MRYFYMSDQHRITYASCYATCYCYMLHVGRVFVHTHFASALVDCPSHSWTEIVSERFYSYINKMWRWYEEDLRPILLFFWCCFRWLIWWIHAWDADTVVVFAVRFADFVAGRATEPTQVCDISSKWETQYWPWGGYTCSRAIVIALGPAATQQRKKIDNIFIIHRMLSHRFSCQTAINNNCVFIRVE